MIDPANVHYFESLGTDITMLGRFADDQDQLTRDRIATEQSVIHAAAALHEQNEITPGELVDLYERAREHATTGWSKRWSAVLPNITALRHRASNLPNGLDGTWYGLRHLADHDPRPSTGMCIVYRLWDEDDSLAYIGSTESFTSRLGHHRVADKDWVRWDATLYPNRASMLAAEGIAIREQLPRRNIDMRPERVTPR